MSAGSVEIFLLVVLILVYVYSKLTKNFYYWKKRGIAGPEPIVFFGTFKDVLLRKVHFADYLKSIYDAYPDEPLVGLFMGRSKILLIKDLEIIKDVMIKSFPIFADRGVKVYNDVDPMTQNLLFLEPKRWKPLRKRLTPTFTSGRLREMFYLILECADRFEKYLEKLVIKGEPIECCEVTAKYTTDVIGICVFGLNMNAISDEDSEFRKIGRSLFANTVHNRLRRSLKILPHWLARLVKPFIYEKGTVDFFINTVKQTMDRRAKSTARRNDFVDLLMDIKNDPKEIHDEEMTDMLITAQIFIFFIAGFETSSATMSHAMYELAKNLDVQDKLRNEVKTTFENNNGKLNYDNIKNMKYMDKVIKETLRMYPPAFVITRKSMEDHTFILKDVKIQIPKYTNIFIPTHAIHYDKNIHADPEKFDPERFDEQVASKRHDMSFLAFGDGPRNCIGERFALNETKVGLATVLQKFKFEICEKTDLTYEKDSNVSLMAPKNGIYLKILRKYPTGSILQRKATSEYTFSEQKVTIPKDTKVLIPVWAIHHDPEIFPDPEKFDPERFNEENEKMRHPMNYLPFGDGPHNCIGYPFGICQTKIGVIAVIKKFQLEVCEKTDIPYQINPRAAVSTPINGIHLKITKL
ncbi:probable cytochrome P450 6a13 [Copidosoma floridanum]|uniref:probable cytochrome P450 6a13 n=1 Tax=Copidosoma floridanum TaxID=29053 RepID=UPI000C6FA316|nr:probable cytochrome P450 6a13 [Copidosoma floridanum]